MPEPYYDYTRNPPIQNPPHMNSHFESTSDWPKTFDYVANLGYQGLHPPAPVYQTNQPAQQNMYYFGVSLILHLTTPSLTFGSGQHDLSWRLLCQRSLLWHHSSRRIRSRLALLFFLILLYPYYICFPFHLLQLSVVQLSVLQLHKPVPIQLLTILHSTHYTLHLSDRTRRTRHAMVSTFPLGCHHRCCAGCRHGRRECHDCCHSKLTILLRRQHRSGDPGPERHHRSSVRPSNCCA
jgi:hypothetical protein